MLGSSSFLTIIGLIFVFSVGIETLLAVFAAFFSALARVSLKLNWGITSEGSTFSTGLEEVTFSTGLEEVEGLLTVTVSFAFTVPLFPNFFLNASKSSIFL